MKMIFAPDDNGVSLGVFAEGLSPVLTEVMIWALSTGKESPQKMLEETRQLLHDVDRATVVAMNQLRGDEDIQTVARQWAFFGPGIFRQLERISGLDGFRSEDLAILANLNAFLTVRKLSLELNGVDVPLVVA
jgi:hypothetical protein